MNVGKLLKSLKDRDRDTNAQPPPSKEAIGDREAEVYLAKLMSGDLDDDDGSESSDDETELKGLGGIAASSRRPTAQRTIGMKSQRMGGKDLVSASGDGVEEPTAPVVPVVAVAAPQHPRVRFVAHKPPPRKKGPPSKSAAHSGLEMLLTQPSARPDQSEGTADDAPTTAETVGEEWEDLSSVAAAVVAVAAPQAPVVDSWDDL